MNQSFSLIFITCISFLSAQWTQFDLHAAGPTDFKSNVLPLFHQSALSVGFHPFLPPVTNHRLHTGSVLSRGVDLTGSGVNKKELRWLPMFHGSLWVTPNLTIRGKMGGFSTGETLVQLWGSGLSLRPQKVKTDRFWEFTADVGRMEVVQQYYLNSYTFALKRVLSLKTIPAFIAIESSQFNVHFHKQANPAFPAKIEARSRFISTGALFKLGPLFLAPQIAGNTKFVSIFMDLYLEFN